MYKETIQLTVEVPFGVGDKVLTYDLDLGGQPVDMMQYNDKVYTVALVRTVTYETAPYINFYFLLADDSDTLLESDGKAAWFSTGLLKPVPQAVATD